MWCRKCQQDVPGSATESGGRFGCPRCGEQFVSTDGTQAASPAGNSSAAASGPSAGAPPAYDGWELDEQLRHIQRILDPGHRETEPRVTKSPDRTTTRRRDAPHAGPPHRHATPSAKTARRRHRDEPGVSTSAIGVLAWTALSLGTAAFVCGGVLLGWALFGGREELHALGLPIALGGQVALLIGLLLQLDRLWNHSHTAAAKHDNVDEQLHELKTATTLLGTTHSSAAGAFYSHLVGGASPGLLLNDLKSQLDILALKLSDKGSTNDE